MNRIERAQEREDIIKAIHNFDTEALNALIEKGADFERLTRDKKLLWNVRKFFFPETSHLETFSKEE